tara:strand:+ start:4863 stop:5549 length:687 start_codon:yes stop_codon:yes gene_type:complete
MSEDRIIKPVSEPKFGPYLARYRAHEGLIKGLKERGMKSIPGSGNKELAGVIDDQRGYSQEDKEWFVKEFQPYMSVYSRACCEHENGMWDEQWSDKFELIALWINYMKENEYNPPHTHNGQVTWVIFLETPDLDKERDAYVGRSVGPGALTFHYGEATFPKWNINQITYNPMPGEMWIFPTLLEHSVIPFKTPGTRVSVSGNLVYMPPNMQSQVMPQQFDRMKPQPIK